MMNRRKAREFAFILLFEYKFQPDCIMELLEEVLTENDAGMQAEYIREVIEGAVSKVDELDLIIEEYAKGWSKDRISNVCMAVMRLAVYEMKYMTDIPGNVSVNEAVTLAKKYDGEESINFVNGILGNIKENCQA